MKNQELSESWILTIFRWEEPLLITCLYVNMRNGEWINPRIEALHLIPTHPAAMAFTLWTSYF